MPKDAQQFIASEIKEESKRNLVKGDKSERRIWHNNPAASAYCQVDYIDEEWWW